MRVTTKNFKIPGKEIVIPKGLQILIPIYFIQNDPEYFPRPDLFDPERFSEKNKKNRHPYSYIPFGEGPRICIGKCMFCSVLNLNYL